MTLPQSPDSQILNPSQVEAIVRAVESAMDVRRRYQFFVWTQSHLQQLIPHQLMVCGAYLRSHRAVMFDAFNSVPIDDALLASFTSERSPLMQHLQTLWIDAGCRPMLIATTRLDGEVPAQVRDGLAGAGFHELLVHGLSRPQRPGEVESFFMMARQATAIVAATPSRHLDMLMPHLNATWQRVQTFEREFSGSPHVLPAALALRALGATGITERERQILSWLREGKSNQQIGEVLGISALTVKNHVQKILRKLNAANRAQAVARAMAMNLLDRLSGDELLARDTA